MKMYHEVAYIKDGNKTVGYIVKEGDVRSINPYRIMNKEQFTRAVSQNLVQYFQIENGSAVVKYTDEELSVLNKYKFPALMGNEYRQNDIHFRADDINELINNGRGILNMLGVMSVPLIKVPVVSGLLFAPKNVIERFIQVFSNDPQCKLFLMTLQNGGNWVNLGLPLSTWERNTAVKIFLQRTCTSRIGNITKKKSLVTNVGVSDPETINRVKGVFNW